MADVFISYAQTERHAAEKLAELLQFDDYDVWWDVRLYAGEDFHDRILEEIEKAKAVIVIWSNSAVRSVWVRGEASVAQSLGKLITAHVPGFDLNLVPINFKVFHVEDVTQTSKIKDALRHLGVFPKEPIDASKGYVVFYLPVELSGELFYPESRFRPFEKWKSEHHAVGKQFCIDTCTEIIAKGEKRPDALSDLFNNRGVAYLYLGPIQNAIDDFTRAIGLNPAHDSSLANRGIARAIQGRFVDEHEDFGHALRLTPSSATHFLNKGASYEMEGNFEGAIREFTSAIVQSPTYDEPYNRRGIAYNTCRKYEQAVADFDQALRLKPDSAIAYVNRAESFFQLGKIIQALADCDAALRLSPKWTRLYLKRGKLHLANRDYPSAIGEFTKLIKSKPNDALALLNRGIVYQKNGAADLAKRDFFSALAIPQTEDNSYIHQTAKERLRELNVKL
jgi:tetratricopeptide (TPR) repeat protein